MSDYTADSWQFRKDKAAYLQEFPICWLCGHAGANEIDHFVPVSVAPHLAFVKTNWRPAHGTDPCPVCRKVCNQERGTGNGQTALRSRAW